MFFAQLLATAIIASVILNNNNNHSSNKRNQSTNKGNQSSQYTLPTLSLPSGTIQLENKVMQQLKNIKEQLRNSIIGNVSPLDILAKFIIKEGLEFELNNVSYISMESDIFNSNIDLYQIKLENNIKLMQMIYTNLLSNKTQTIKFYQKSTNRKIYEMKISLIDINISYQNSEVQELYLQFTSQNWQDLHNKKNFRTFDSNLKISDVVKQIQNKYNFDNVIIENTTNKIGNNNKQFQMSDFEYLVYLTDFQKSNNVQHRDAPYIVYIEDNKLYFKSFYYNSVISHKLHQTLFESTPIENSPKQNIIDIKDKSIYKQNVVCGNRISYYDYNKNNINSQIFNCSINMGNYPLLNDKPVISNVNIQNTIQMNDFLNIDKNLIVFKKQIQNYLENSFSIIVNNTSPDYNYLIGDIVKVNVIDSQISKDEDYLSGNYFVSNNKIIFDYKGGQYFQLLTLSSNSYNHNVKIKGQIKNIQKVKPKVEQYKPQITYHNFKVKPLFDFNKHKQLLHHSVPKHINFVSHEHSVINKKENYERMIIDRKILQKPKITHKKINKPKQTIHKDKQIKNKIEFKPQPKPIDKIYHFNSIHHKIQPLHKLTKPTQNNIPSYKQRIHKQIPRRITHRQTTKRNNHYHRHFLFNRFTR